MILVIILTRYLKDGTPFGSSLPIFCALLAVASIILLSQYDNKTLSSSPISKVAQSATGLF
jgi:hypothetical protein